MIGHKVFCQRNEKELACHYQHCIHQMIMSMAAKDICLEMWIATKKPNLLVHIILISWDFIFWKILNILQQLTSLLIPCLHQHVLLIVKDPMKLMKLLYYWIKDVYVAKVCIFLCVAINRVFKANKYLVTDTRYKTPKFKMKNKISGKYITTDDVDAEIKVEDASGDESQLW